MRENREYVKSLNEKEINTRALEALILAFNAKNAQLFDEILHDDGVFLNNLTKNEALDFFQDQFYNRRFGMYKYKFIKIYRGISLDVFPGAEMIEIRNAACPYISDFGEEENPFINEHVLRFTFRFKDGRVSEIGVPEKFLSYADYRRIKN